MACQINVAVEWPRSVPVEIRSADPITVTVDTTQGLPGPEGPQGPPGPGSEVQDTGWLDLPADPGFPFANIKIRRWGPWVALSINADTLGADMHGSLLCAIPPGFLPAVGTFAFGSVLDPATFDTDGVAYTVFYGATLWFSHGTGGAAQYQWLTPDAFPET